MNTTLSRLTLATLFTLSLSACDFSCAKKEKIVPPSFDANYAYDIILQYEKFGPKVPGTEAHKIAADWMVSELKSSGATVHEQVATAKTYDNKTIPIRNIIGQVNPSAKRRYLLSAHYDNRPFSDEDPNKKLQNKPVPGVNDGGSGVAILLGIARSFKDNPPKDFGVDFLLNDAEDWGIPSIPESYCLGTQYWVKNLVPAKYIAEYGINFDMVGRIGSVFPVERMGYQKGSHIYQKLHAAALKLGYQDLFPKYEIGPIVDDHVFLMRGLGIPVINIIYMTEEGGFAPEWHTQQDTSEYISRDVLKAVGETALHTLFND